MAAGNGLADLERRIKAMGTAARAEIGKALDQSAAEIVSNARTLAPVDAEDGGQLKASIHYEQGPHELHRVILAGGETTTRPVRDGASATYDYALAQELGTAEQSAQPFFYPAWRLGKKRAIGRINRAVKKAAKAAGWST